jgi:hypothetical protein
LLAALDLILVLGLYLLWNPDSSSVISASVIVSSMLFAFAFRMRKHRRTRAPFGVSIASSSRFFGQPGPWLTSAAF